MYAWVSPLVSFPQVYPPKPRTRISLPSALRAPPISFFSILSPAQYWVRSTDHSAPHYVLYPLSCYLVPPRPKYSPQHPILKHPQPTYLPLCQRPSFTPILFWSYLRKLYFNYIASFTSSKSKSVCNCHTVVFLWSQCVSILQGEHHILYRKKYLWHFRKRYLATAHTIPKTHTSITLF